MNGGILLELENYLELPVCQLQQLCSSEKVIKCLNAVYFKDKNLGKDKVETGKGEEANTNVHIQTTCLNQNSFWTLKLFHFRQLTRGIQLTMAKTDIKDFKQNFIQTNF